jgi:flavorubredoxin
VVEPIFAEEALDGEEFSIGSRRMKWLYTPHVPHGWDCGILFDQTTKTLLCGDLFTQPGSNTPPVAESEILTASEGMRGMMDYYAHARDTTPTFERLADLRPAMLACQHGSAYRGDGAALLRELAATIEREARGRRLGRTAASAMEVRGVGGMSFDVA